MKQQFTITTVGLWAGLGLIAAVAASAARHLSSLAEQEGWVQHTHEVLESAQALSIAVEDAVAQRRAFGLTRDESVLASYRSTIARARLARAELHRLTADNPAQQQRLDHLDAVIDERLAQLEEAIREVRALGQTPEREVQLTSAGDALTARLRALLVDVESDERRLLEGRQAAARAGSARVQRTLLGGFGVSIVILLLAFLALRREVARRARSEERLAEREQRLVILLGSIGDAVIATDAAGRLTHINPVAEQVTGWRAAEAVGRPFGEVFRIVSEKTRAPEPDPVARVLSERIKIGLANHTLLIARDGVERPIADSAAPILDAAGRLQGVVIVFRDVTETRGIEARFRLLVEAAPDAIVIAGSDGRITIANDQASALFGYSTVELIGQPIEALMPELLREEHAAQSGGFGVAPAARSGLQLQARRKDGRLCAVEVNLSPLPTPDGTQVIAAVRDVTRRRELERFRDEYVGYISHDLKNPLSVIALQARLLARKLDGRPAKEEQHAVAVIAESAAFIDRLVRELLEMAYVESDEIELHPDPLELSGFLQSVLERTVSTPDRSRVLLEIAAPCTVSAESGRLERVVVNFVQNAIKYSPPGSRIQVRLEAQEDFAEVSVIDRGPGIAKEEQQSIFEKYKRAPEARNKEGLGLGLYVSRKIAEAHGGVVGVESVPGQGARFYIRLPRIAAQAAAAAIGPVEQAERSDLHGLRVLLVDDEVNAVSALTTLLSDEGLIVAPATSGEQALAALASARPDVAVLDVQMPGMSGLELLGKLRVRHPGLPAVIMSGHMERHAGIAEARLSTGAAYVGKPVNVDDLLRTLGRLFLARPPS